MYTIFFTGVVIENLQLYCATVYLRNGTR